MAPKHQDPHDLGGFAIGELERRTGVAAATLRVWESRHGFPRSARLESGHRRYYASDVGLVRAVLERRAAGLPLAAAIAAVVRAHAVVSPSVHAEVRGRHPQLATHVLRKASLVSLSHALEDEATSVAQRPWMFGAFQHEEFYRAAQSRWRDMARTAPGAWVLADLKPSRGAKAPVEVALPPSSDLLREWVVLFLGPTLPFCLTAMELPGQELPDHKRRFQTMWTLDPHAVHDAARSLVATLSALGQDLTAVEAYLEVAKPTPVAPELKERVYARVVEYLDRSNAGD